jgi:outer membrane protein assembly factor BamB
LELDWPFDLKQNGFGRPLVHNDGVVVASRRQLFCLDHRGEVRWQLGLPGATSATPALVEHFVLVPTEKGVLLWVDLLDGSIGRETPLGHACGTSVEVFGDRLYLSLGGTRLGPTGALLCLDKQGAVVWQYEAEQGFPVTPLVTEKLVVATDREGRTVALERESGKPAWEFSGGTGALTSPILLGDGEIVLTSNPTTCVHPTGRQLWQKKIAGSAAADLGSDLLLATYEGPLCRYSPTGQHVWTTADSGYVNPQFHNGCVWAGHKGGTYRSLSPETGEELARWQAPPGPRGQKIVSDWGCPVFHQDRIFVVSPHTQVLYCLRAHG